MREAVSARLLDQRLRNRMIEAVARLAEWKNSIAQGAAEYFNGFFFIFPDSPPLPANSALSRGERSALTDLLVEMDNAANETPDGITMDELIASGWPERIQPLAERALKLMMERGRFSEEVEEDTPSAP